MMLAAAIGQEDSLLEVALELEEAAPWARIDAGPSPPRGVPEPIS
jgi:hypothetical protein